jgi:hypothetical protein
VTGASVKQGFWVAAFAAWATIGAASAGSLYLTVDHRLEDYGLDEGYTFIAPYFTDIETTLWVSITKAATTSTGAGNSGNNQQQNKPALASIYFASWQQSPGEIVAPYEIKYAVSCDLSSILKANYQIVTTGFDAKSSYDGLQTVTRTDASSVYVKAGATDPGPAKFSASAANGATLNVFCPSASEPPSFALTYGVTTTPKQRAYLYATKNPFFSDNINVSLDGNGMLSGSDSSSTQQITAILTELAQTAGLALGGIGFPSATSANFDAKGVDQPNPRQQCFAAIAALTKYGPYYANDKSGDKNVTRGSAPWTRNFAIDSKNAVSLQLRLEPLAGKIGQERLASAVPPVRLINGDILKAHAGLLAFYPLPAKATLTCVVGQERVSLNTPSIINLYASSQFVDPKRDFLTGPQDTFTFNSGFIVGHKFADQSSAKTIVDTITAPLRALIPSVSVQQTTQVLTGGGKPDQTTTTTQSTTGPPKSP